MPLRLPPREENTASLKISDAPRTPAVKIDRLDSPTPLMRIFLPEIDNEGRLRNAEPPPVRHRANSVIEYNPHALSGEGNDYWRGFLTPL